MFELTCRRSFYEGNPSELRWRRGPSPPCRLLSPRDIQPSICPHTGPGPVPSGRPVGAGTLQQDVTLTQTCVTDQRTGQHKETDNVKNWFHKTTEVQEHQDHLLKKTSFCCSGAHRSVLPQRLGRKASAMTSEEQLLLPISLGRVRDQF